MFRNIVFSAFGAALAIGLALSVLQSFTTEPLILHAEEYEGGATQEHAAASGWIAAHAHEHEAVAATADGDGWVPADGIERSAYTILANLVIGFGVSLTLLGFMVLKGDPIDARTGLTWGVAAFFAVSLLPALGLPPELPGTPAAEIMSRQAWWLATAGGSAGGIALLVFGRQWWLMAAGVLLILAPHVIGAPQPPSHDVPYPGGLAGQYVVASLVVSAALWTLASATSGWLYRRLSAGG
jgi:cobalt transporter subunit CbtA